MNETTRTSELELLELARDKVGNSGEDSKFNRRSSILESIWEQTKDPTLEKMRKELQRWVIYGLDNAPEEEMEPTKEQRMAMATAQINIERIEKLVQSYVQSPGIRDKLISKMHMHDPDYAESLVVKHKRRSK